MVVTQLVSLEISTPTVNTHLCGTQSDIVVLSLVQAQIAYIAKANMPFPQLVILAFPSLRTLTVQN